MSVTPLPFTLSVDKVITVKGTANADCNRFSINLSTGSDFNEDVPFHFNPRVDQEQVVRNTFSSGSWGEEEVQGGLPFTQDAPYEVKITVKEGHYQVSVNGSHFCDFVHRLPIESVRNIFIEGDTTANVGFTQSVYPVPFSISEGVEIVVNGVPSSSAYRFSINLGAGTDFSGDIPLHFNPRFDNNEVVRNHHKDGWGETEEKEGEFPFSQGTPYEVKIAVRQTHFQVFVNGSDFCHFNHRLDKEVIRNVFIEGDSDVHNVKFVDKTPINNPSVPVCTPIKGGMVLGAKILISGKVTSDPERFSVNFLCGSDFESSDLALHFDARLNYGEAQNYSVRTHRSGGDYGKEDREEPFFPFSPDAEFSMTVAVEPDGFQIFVNEQHHSTFAHRIEPLERVDHIEVHGDVQIQQIRFE